MSRHIPLSPARRSLLDPNDVGGLGGDRAEHDPSDPRTHHRPADIEAIYRTHVKTVLRWVLRLGGPGIDAEDVVQDVFVVAKRRLQSFEGAGKITTWLFRTTEKVVLSARRKQRLRRWLARSPDPGAAGVGGAPATPGDILERERDVRNVYRVLDRLPERHRKVLILFELEGLSTDEISELMGAKPGTVRVCLFRARARFLEEHQRLFRDVERTRNE
jgi:RNA polymerase sigma-70 factor, ECF subfamily